MTFVADLKPTALWKHFDTILTIPRGSKNEEGIRCYVMKVAKQNGLDTHVDGTGNVIVSKHAAADRQGIAAIALQSHLDMVNEKNAGLKHDFTKDPIVPRTDGSYLTASGTTLGSDNGIGVAAMLALMEATDQDMVHGPLEFLFTVDEETGLTGAAGLDGDVLRSRRLINLDSEEEGVLYVGCAGGGDSQVVMKLNTEDLIDDKLVATLALTGLKGGHSGCDIHLQRGNALKLLARILRSARVHTAFKLLRFQGGSAHNAIPREAFAGLVLDPMCYEELCTVINREFTAIKEQYHLVDSDMQLTLDETETPSAREVWDDHTTATVLHVLDSLPNGVIAMSYEIPGLVETSTNLATVSRDGASLIIGSSSRSSDDSALEAVRRQIRAVGLLAGATVHEGTSYPGWKPDLQSHLLEIVKNVHRRELASEPEVKAIHAGLECGIIGKKVPGIDMISFGPVIEYPHSPDERVHIESVGRFYRLLTASLESLS